jgi:ADP-ribose pyrophosphatase YjhB (NUDIX family)
VVPVRPVGGCETLPVSDTTETANSWLSDEDLETVRGRVPMVYVDAVPVRVDALGEVTHIGLLLRAMADGTVSRALVTGRIQFGERIRSALMRHLEKDLGPMALPRIPANPTPFTVAEYFPDPTVSGYHDPRQHAVSLAYVVPIDGEPEPSEDALDLAWVTPAEAASPEVREEMTGGHDRLLRLALAHVCQLP